MQVLLPAPGPEKPEMIPNLAPKSSKRMVWGGPGAVLGGFWGHLGPKSRESVIREVPGEPFCEFCCFRRGAHVHSNQENMVSQR